MRPILLNSCAQAATAKEAGFRLQVPVTLSRAARVIALDDGVKQLVSNVGANEWHTARFFEVDPGSTRNGQEPRFRSSAGEVVEMDQLLEEADLVVFVASDGSGAEVADAIGSASPSRGVMTVGLAIEGHAETTEALHALRPNAMVLLDAADEDDLVNLLIALRT